MSIQQQIANIAKEQITGTDVSAASARAGFVTGANYVLSLIPGLVEWTDANAVRAGQHEFTVGAGREQVRYTTQEVIDKYFEHLKTNTHDHTRE